MICEAMFYQILLSILLANYVAKVESVPASISPDCGARCKAVEDPAVTKFRDYLRIPTNHPNPEPGYEKAITWLTTQAKEIGLEVKLVRMNPLALFALIFTWRGSDPSLPSVLLNSHMDLVAVEPSQWKYPPFEAFKDENGTIWARGTCDMKGATMAQIEAIRRLKQAGHVPLRTTHMTIMPDEEMSGTKGTQAFVETDDFKNLNVGIDIDEGGTNAGSTLAIVYGEKSPWQFNITAYGMSAHGAALPEFTAGQRLQVVIDRLFEFRADQVHKLLSGELTFEQVSSVNLVQLGGGIAHNIIPSEVWAQFDMRIRIRPEFGFADYDKMLADIIEAARLGPKDDPNNKVEITFRQKSRDSGETATNSSNIWWTVVRNSCQELNITCVPYFHFAASDGRFIRSSGIPVFGIGPFLNTPFTGHQANERMNEVEFLKAIGRYQILIRNLSRQPGR